MSAPSEQTLSDQKLRLGFGASGAWAKGWFSEREAIRLIHKAYDAGVRDFDTAGFYAGGEAERRLGLALKGRSEARISTKVGTRQGSWGRLYKDFSLSSMKADLEASLKRLQRDEVECLYLHGPETWVVDNTRAFFTDLKLAGHIRSAGVCGEGKALDDTVTQSLSDVIMGRYHLFDQAHGRIFQRAQETGIRTVAIAPLGQALYRRHLFVPKSPSDLWALARGLIKNRDSLKHQRQQRVRDLHHFDGFTAAQAMLGFVLSNPDVDIAMSTTTRMPHLTEMIDMARAGGLDREILDRLDAIAKG